MKALRQVTKVPDFDAAQMCLDGCAALPNYIGGKLEVEGLLFGVVTYYTLDPMLESLGTTESELQLFEGQSVVEVEV